MKNNLVIGARYLRDDRYSDGIIRQIRAFIDLLSSTGQISDWELSYGEADDLSVNVRNQEIEECLQSSSKQLVVKVYLGHQAGSATCLGTQWSDWTATLENAIGIAKLSQPDPFDSLPPREYYQTTIPTLQLQSSEEVDFHDLVARAKLIESIGQKNLPEFAHLKLQSDGSSVGAEFHWTVRANSRGLWAAIPSSFFGHSLSLLAHSDHDHESDGAYESQRCFHDLEAIEKFALKAQRRTCLKIGKKKVQSGLYPVIFSPRSSRSLIKYLCTALSGRSQYLNTTFLKDFLGKKILPSWVHIHDQPHLSWGIDSYPIDSDGLITRSHDWIVEGQVKEYLLSYYSAQRLKLSPNHLASGLKNVQMTTNAVSLEELVKKYPKCVVIDATLGNGVNLVQGTYSQGVEGFYYENGERVHALQEVTVATTLIPFYASLEYHASDFEFASGMQIGSLAFPEMRVSSQ